MMNRQRRRMVFLTRSAISFRPVAVCRHGARLPGVRLSDELVPVCYRY